MGGYYPDDYGPYVGTKVQKSGEKNVSNMRGFIKAKIKKIFRLNAQVLPVTRAGSLLEIGCASGAFMHQMAGLGWRVEGVEFSEKAARNAANLGLKVQAGSLEEAQLAHNAFDLVVGWMVLEHLHDPVGSLRKLRQCAKQDSWLVLSVPNAGSLEFRMFLDKWYALHLPNHLFHFTPSSIRKLLLKSGWSLEHVFHQRSLVNLAVSLGYVVREKGFERLGKALIRFPENAKFWNYAFFPIAWLLSAFGQTGRMTIWARPIAEFHQSSRESSV
jgi:2-polyprenyl-3-methyl-5-hydroxy-6-metoxy-1,4-benzoquinol methylase